MAWIGLLTAAAGLLACEPPTAPLPGDARRFDPPAAYVRWWGQAQACSGLRGNLTDVTWYAVPGEAVIGPDRGAYGGYWYERGNQIVLADATKFAGDLVRHEMLHALTGSGGHSRTLFLDQCEGTVVCALECVTDAGPAPPADPAAQVVAPATLVLGVEVVPQTPRTSFEEGTFQMIITARNPLSYPVVVDIPPDESGFVFGYGYAVADVGDPSREAFGRFAVKAPETTRYRAGQTKSFIVDFQIGQANIFSRRLPAGTYRFEGSFAGIPAPTAPIITVGP